MSKKVKKGEDQVCRGVKDKQKNNVNKGCSRKDALRRVPHLQ